MSDGSFCKVCGPQKCTCNNQSKDDGGPAFPEHHYFDPGRGKYGMHMTASDIGCGGMSLRDYFAGKATEQDIYAHIRGGGTREQARYEYADAMLAERKK